METIVDIHSWIRWLVMLGLVAGVGLGISRHLKGDPWAPGTFSAAVIAFDIQVLLGVILYLGNEGWEEGVFIAVFHPIFMVAALAVAHVGISFARRREAEDPNRIIGYAFFVSVVLVIAGVPWDRLST